MSSEAGGIPFAFLCSLLREISRIKPRPVAATWNRKETRTSYPALGIFERWLENLRQQYLPLPSGTAPICFRLLFPEEDIKRKYDIQETRLANYLSQCLGLPRDNLENWNSNDSPGCLGNELKRLLQPKFPDGDEATSSLTITKVDELLDELAATSGFTHVSIRDKYPHPRRSKLYILKSLFRPLPPQEAAFMTHIILKDLRPILYPSPEVNASVALLDFNTNAVKLLTKEHVISSWDPTGYMLNLHRVKADLDEAARAFELPPHIRPTLRPNLGSMIRLPKSVKGTSCRHALSYFRNSETVWAETKYDGERAQIHVEIHQDGSSKITIFSKSGRDSTWDRHGVHDIIRESLRLSTASNQSRSRIARVRRNIVLDAEMVAWYEDHIDEFWRIRGLIEQTASGIRGKPKQKDPNNSGSQGEDCGSELSMMTDESQSRHLALVFFDILVLEDQPLVFQTYATRRQLLETYIQTIPTKAMISERHRIDVSGSDANKALQIIFAEHLAGHLEGVVLKADESQYNEFRLPWVKLKKDYIKSFGDCVDLTIVAAGWDRDRARELRVTPSVYTTFYVGAITNVREIQLQPNMKPHILVYFTVSYGLSRKELEDLNFRIRNSDNVTYPPTHEDINALPFTFTLSAHLKSRPQTILFIPFLAELLCAGFSKEHQSRYYEPRFPRFTKIHDKRERPWTECMDISELDKIARECVGKDHSAKDVDDWCKSLWGKPTSPTIRMKRQDRVQDILVTLANIERSPRSLKEYPKRRKVEHVEQKIAVISSTLNPAPKQHNTETLQDCDNTNTKGMSLAVNQVAHITAGASLDSSSDILDAAVSCFMNSRKDRHCGSCLRWKKVVPKKRRVHSLEALVTACRQGEGGLVNIKRGLVFVDASDATVSEWTLKTVQNNASHVKVRVLVFGCNVERLSEENALLIV